MNDECGMMNQVALSRCRFYGLSTDYTDYTDCGLCLHRRVGCAHQTDRIPLKNNITGSRKGAKNGLALIGIFCCGLLLIFFFDYFMYG